MIKKITFEKSSGNVFQDMGLKNPKSRLSKAKMSSKISDIAKKYDIDNKSLSLIFAISEKELDDIFHGRLGNFTEKKLKTFLNLLKTYV